MVGIFSSCRGGKRRKRKGKMGKEKKETMKK